MQLVILNLTCRRAERRLFKDLNFVVEDGQSLMVTGPNGAGKSSLLAILAERLRPESGDIRLEGWEGLRSEALHWVGHRDGLKTALTAQENLAFAQRMLGSALLSPLEALERVGLAHIAAMRVGDLSAGQRRRVALARLLVAKRPLWLLDEPAAALDLASQEMLTGLMQEHLQQGGMLIAATHQPLGLTQSQTLSLGAS